eukprot:2387750-Prymnesium_polylepis.1
MSGAVVISDPELNGAPMYPTTRSAGQENKRAQRTSAARRATMLSQAAAALTGQAVGVVKA